MRCILLFLNRSIYPPLRCPDWNDSAGALCVCACRDSITYVKQENIKDNDRTNNIWDRTGRPSGTDALAGRRVDRPLAEAQPVVHGLATATDNGIVRAWLYD